MSDISTLHHEVFNLIENRVQEVIDSLPSLSDDKLIETRRRARDLGQIAWCIECAADAEIVKRDIAKGAKGVYVKEKADEAGVTAKTLYLNKQVNDVVDSYCQTHNVVKTPTNINFDKSLVIASLSAANPPEMLDELLKKKDEAKNNGYSFRQALKHVEEMTGIKAQVTVWTGNNERYTPMQFIDMAREVMGGIDVDPASNDYVQTRIQAKTYFTYKENGLCQEWNGRVWLNPPYSNPEIGQFIDKLIEEYQEGRTTAAVLLTNNSADTLWFDRASRHASAICFTKGRINFYDEKDETTQPTNGQTFFYFGKDADAFRETFSSVGGIYHRIA